MLKNFYQVKKQREDWAKKIKFDKESIFAKLIKEQLLDKLNKLNIDLKGKRIVQLGCFGGYFIDSFLNLGAHVHAVDYSQTMLDITRKRLSREPLQPQLSPIIRDFSILSDFAFDIVIAVTMLERLPEQMTERIIQDAKRLLKEKTGIFIFRLPLVKKHHTKVDYHTPALDTVFWTKKELEKLGEKYKYKSVDVDDISIFYKGSHQ